MIYKGVATVYGIGGTITGAAIVNLTSLSAQSVGLEHQFDVGKLKDATGVVKGLYVVEDFRNLDITFIPQNASAGAGAATTAMLAALVFMGPITNVVLAGFTVTEFNKAYAYMGGSIQLSNEGPASYKIKLQTFGNADLTVTPT